jgi:hypothetical protein
MTPKEKAKELIEKYLKLDIEIGGQYDGYLTMKMHDAKQCALIAVDEILSIDVLIDEDTWVSKTSYLEYWKEVKKELEKI